LSKIYGKNSQNDLDPREPRAVLLLLDRSFDYQGSVMHDLGYESSYRDIVGKAPSVPVKERTTPGNGKDGSQIVIELFTKSDDFW
jgi:hypothetical protein